MASDGILGDLPGAVRAMVPEIADPEGEPRATCADCVMLPAHLGAGHPWAFSPDTRCCTYHPRLPNYLAGRALERGGAGAAAIRRRLAEPSGLSRWGIAPFDDYPESHSDLGFGHEPALRCPFWVGGAASCGIWPDRTTVCRAWFCRHDHGEQGRARWMALEAALTAVEDRLARWCLEQLGPGEGAPSSWERWYLRCAKAVDSLEGGAAASLRTAAISDRVATYLDKVDDYPEAPAAPVAQVDDACVVDDALYLRGYPGYDHVETGAKVLDLLAAVDGRTPLGDALAAAGLDHEAGRDLARELTRIGVLRAGPAAASPAGDAPLPELLVVACRRPIVIGDRAWLQAADGTASATVPRAVFQVLSGLDGRTPWRPLVARSPEVDAATIDRLYRTGVLRAAL